MLFQRENGPSTSLTRAKGLDAKACENARNIAFTIMIPMGTAGSTPAKTLEARVAKSADAKDLKSFSRRAA